MLNWHNGDKPVEIRGGSKVYTDEGGPLPYVIRYCPGQRVWWAEFECTELARGTLSDCIAACEVAEDEARRLAQHD